MATAERGIVCVEATHDLATIVRQHYSELCSRTIIPHYYTGLQYDNTTTLFYGEHSPPVDWIINIWFRSRGAKYCCCRCCRIKRRIMERDPTKKSCRGSVTFALHAHLFFVVLLPNNATSSTTAGFKLGKNRCKCSWCFFPLPGRPLYALYVSHVLYGHRHSKLETVGLSDCAMYHGVGGCTDDLLYVLYVL